MPNHWEGKPVLQERIQFFYASLWLSPTRPFIACECIQKYSDTQQWNAAEPVFLDAILLRHRSIVLLTAAVKYQGVFEAGLWHPFVWLVWIQAWGEKTRSRRYSLSRCCTCCLSCLLRRKKENPETEHMKVWGAQCACSANTTRKCTQRNIKTTN